MPTASLRRSSHAIFARAGFSLSAVVLLASGASGDFPIIALTISPGSTYTINPDSGAAILRSTGTAFAAAGGNGFTRTPDGFLWYTTNQFSPGGVAADGLVRLSPDALSIIDARPIAAGIDTVFALASFTSDSILVSWRSGSSIGDPFFLSSINPADGSINTIGQLRTPEGSIAAITGADFAPDGTLFGWESLRGLVRINPATGLVTDVNPADASPLMQSIAWGPDGFLFGVTGSVPNASDRFSLFRIDPLGGSATRVGPFGANLDIRGIEIVPSPAPAAVVLSTLALIPRRRR